MGYGPVSKVLSTYIPMEELALAQPQAEPVIVDNLSHVSINDIGIVIM